MGSLALSPLMTLMGPLEAAFALDDFPHKENMYCRYCEIRGRCEEEGGPR